MHAREIALALAALASTAAALVFRHELNEERALTAQLSQRAAPAPVPDRAPPHVTPATSTQATPPSSRQAQPAHALDAVADDRRRDRRAKQRELLEDPRYVAALREQRRLNYRLRRDNAMRLLGFSRETADALIDLDIDGQIRLMSFDPDAPDADMRKEFEAISRERDARTLALLGPERFDRWQTYLETRGTRMQVDRFRSQLDGADQMRDDQVEPLITAMATEQKQMRAEIEEYRDSLSWDGDSTESARKLDERQLAITKAGNQRILASAATILSSSQVKRLADMLNNETARREAQARIESLRRTMGSAPDDGADPD